MPSLKELKERIELCEKALEKQMKLNKLFAESFEQIAKQIDDIIQVLSMS